MCLLATSINKSRKEDIAALYLQSRGTPIEGYSRQSGNSLRYRSEKKFLLSSLDIKLH